MNKKNIFVVGSGRSGTTWVQDLVVQAVRGGSIFEPLHPRAFPHMLNYDERYMSAGCQDNSLKEFIEDVSNGRLSNSWTKTKIFKDNLRLGRRHFKDPVKFKEYIALWAVFCRRFYSNSGVKHVNVTKFIRANLMINWLTMNFDDPVIYVVRHPCAVVESRVRLRDRSWGLDDPYIKSSLRAYATDQQLAELYEVNIEELITNIQNDVEAHALIWCIQNAYLLNSDRPRNVYKFNYEDIIANNARPLVDGLQKIGFSVSNNLKLDKPSDMSSKDSRNNIFKEELVGKWQRRLGNEQLKIIDGYLEIFNVKDYKVDSPLPVGDL